MRDVRKIQTHLGSARSQIVWLTLGGLVALGMTFALGVMVGRRAEKLSAAQHEQPSDPLKQIDAEHKLHDELTYYARLTQNHGERPTVAAAEPLPNKKTRAPDTTKIATDAVEPARVAAPAAPAPAPVPAPAPALEPASDTATGLAKGPAKSGEYTIQVSSFQTAEEATAYASSLKRKGYSPYVVAMQIAGKGTWHRVRLGVFPSSEAATLAKQQLVAADIAGWVVKSE
ncbi:MAG: SPOR domain-containing protein [Myxococcota bacterium]